MLVFQQLFTFLKCAFLLSMGIRDHSHNTSFSSQLKNGPNKLEFFVPIKPSQSSVT